MALVEASIEGPIEEIGPDSLHIGVVIKSMGITIAFVPGPVIIVPEPADPAEPRRLKSIRTPNQRLAMKDLWNADPFPGRVDEAGNPIPGFKGGTVIAEGFFNTDISPNVLIANHITVEPAENVILGALTERIAGNPPTIRVNGTKIVMLTDRRFSSNPPSKEAPDSHRTPIYRNQYGFPITVASIVPVPNAPNPPAPADPPPPTSAEGYYANGEFHAFLFEYGGTGTLVTPADTEPQASFERAQVRDRGTLFEIEARGHITTSHPGAAGTTQDVRIFRLDWDEAHQNWVEDSEPYVGDMQIDFREAGFDRWRFRARIPKGSGRLKLPPERLRVRNLSVSRNGEIAKYDLDTEVRE